MLRRLLRGDDPRVSAAFAAAVMQELHSARLMTLDEACACTFASGIYALYYADAEHAHYGPLDPDTPVYIGRAEPITPNSNSRLAPRVQYLANAVRAAASTLKQECCRVRVVPLDACFVWYSERTLIKHYRPLWNTVITGIGNHAPGKGRIAQVQSAWDTLHPGRAWAAALPENPILPSVMWSAVDAALRRENGAP